MSPLDKAKIFRVAVDIESDSLSSVYRAQICGTLPSCYDDCTSF